MAKVYGYEELPKNYAEMLLNCQIEVELNEVVPKEIVMETLQLYSKGMEYFESIRSYKYMYFERKMNAMMRSPKIIGSMSNTETKSPGQINKVKAMQVKQKYDKMYNDYIGETSSLTGEKIKKIVAENEIKLNEVHESIKDQISQQQKRLQIKIERRKFQKATKKSMSSTALQKSTRDSLFNESQPEIKQQLDIDFTKVINQHEDDSDIENSEGGTGTKGYEERSLDGDKLDNSNG